MKKFTKGFTLIELLIVIALLGALAVGLLAALDPFEQLKKGTDTGVRNTVAELHGASIRYYAIKNAMPWGATINGNAWTERDIIQSIVETGELKSDFTTLATEGTLSKITMIGTDQSITVCFQPQSRSFRSDVNTKYNSSGTELADTSGCSAATTCYWCVK